MNKDEDNEQKEGLGLDKDRRLAERRERRSEESGPEPLDLPFPFRLIAFDPIIVQRQGN